MLAAFLIDELSNLSALFPESPERECRILLLALKAYALQHFCDCFALANRDSPRRRRINVK